jgi:hypothetical protein
VSIDQDALPFTADRDPAEWPIACHAVENAAPRQEGQRNPHPFGAITDQLTKRSSARARPRGTRPSHRSRAPGAGRSSHRVSRCEGARAQSNGAGGRRVRPMQCRANSTAVGPATAVRHGIISTHLGCLNARAGIHLIDHPGTGRSVNCASSSKMRTSAPWQARENKLRPKRVTILCLTPVACTSCWCKSSICDLSRSSPCWWR